MSKKDVSFMSSTREHSETMGPRCTVGLCFTCVSPHARHQFRTDIYTMLCTTRTVLKADEKSHMDSCPTT
ncbi:hypothetical protein DACRYDRAFT_20377 [Dacryopinax primogenitus]|uniref:Uncharacterized protein n=1 Tax=Dacryopinax primogenitus (strain DJM 731) TaxID=1858805 RepID=M5G7M0_DACPD|nr:uncharacterized protein DACRYDRAFT_20377 [Dacryopinax primogenitus]EJU04734.1 hypothetical protein DACRYDRAFT_20377 [Dacryopinax primogenitus]